MRQAVNDETAAILSLSEGEFLEVNIRKKGKLPNGSMMITRVINNVTNGLIVSIPADLFIPNGLGDNLLAGKFFSIHLSNSIIWPFLLRGDNPLV
jgi:ribosomal protein S1